MSSDKRIEIEIAAQTTGEPDIQRLLKMLRDSGQDVAPFEAAAKRLGAEMEKLRSQQALIEQFASLKKASGEAATALALAQEKAQGLGQAFAQTAAPTKTQTAELERAKKAVNDAKQAYEEATVALQNNRSKMQELGIDYKTLATDSKTLAQHQRDVDAAVKQTTKELGDLSNAMALAANESKQKAAADKQALAVEQSEIELQRQHLNLDKETQQSILRLAQARGDEAKAAQASNQLREIEVQKTQLIAREKRAEAAAIEASAAAKRNELSAVGPLTQAQMLELQASENLAKSLHNQAAAADQAAQKARITADASKSLGRSMDSAAEQIVNVKNQLLAFVGVQGFAQTAQEVGKLADQWVNLQARLKLALGPQTDINKAMADVEAVAKRTYTSLEATAALYGKIAAAGKAMGVSQQQALALTESINQSIQLSGASAQASEAAVTQFIQGLQSGVIRGDEFNSIMEQSPRLAQAMADGLKVPIGALRGLAEEGQLTSGKIIRSLQTQADVLNKEFGSLPITIGRSVQNLQTEWLKFIGTLDASTGFNAKAAAGIASIANHLDDLARVAGVAGTALVVSFAAQAAVAMRTAAAEMAATGGAAAVLRTNLDKLSRPVYITLAVVGFELGYQLGEMLHENSALARKLGIGVSEFFTQIVNDLQMVKEAGAAIFTKDTINAALDRYVKRNIEIGNIYRDMYADAEKAPAKIGSAADSATGKVGAMGAAATAAGAAVANAGATGATGIANIGKATDQARIALTGLATAINTKPPADNGLADIAREIENVKLRGEDLNVLLRKNLPDAISSLNGPELAKFRAEFILAMDSAKQALENAIKADKPKAEIESLRAKVSSFEQSTRTGLSLIAEQAAKNLGIDVPLAFNKVSEAFTKSQSDLSVLVRSLPELKAVGVDTAAVVGQALNKMIDGAKNQAELDAIRGRIEALRKELGTKVADGLLDQLADKADAVADAMDRLKPGFQSVEEAMKELGLTSDYTLGVMADKAQKAYESIKNSGTASAQEISQAFAAYAEKSIAAHGGVASAAIKSEAALRGYKVEVDDTGKASLKLVTATTGEAAAFAKATESIKAKSAAARAASDLAISGLELRKSEIDAEIQIAQAHGNTQKVVSLKIEQKRIEIQIIQATVKAQIAEAEAAIAVARAKRSELEASGNLTDEKSSEIDASIKSGQAKINEAKAREASVRVLDDEIKSLKSNTQAEQDNSSAIDDTKKSLSSLNEERSKSVGSGSLYNLERQVSGETREVGVSQVEINDAVAKRFGDEYVGNADAEMAVQMKWQLDSYMKSYGNVIRSKESLAQQAAYASELARLEEKINAEKLAKQAKDGVNGAPMSAGGEKQLQATAPVPRPPTQAQESSKQFPTSVVNLHYNGTAIGPVSTTEEGADTLQKFMRLLQAGKSVAS